MKIAGFAKVRNEIIREGNLYRMLEQLDRLCDGGVIYDDGSTDGTREHLTEWVIARWPCWKLLKAERSVFELEMAAKQCMLDALHTSEERYDWILWLDGDELLSSAGEENFRVWLESHESEADVWAFHYTQLWRSPLYARTDDHFDEGWFWKLWRYQPNLSFDVVNRLHAAQFPRQYMSDAVGSSVRNGDYQRAKRAPFEILHLGNYGKNLAWKAIQYRNSGLLESASLRRHLYFDRPTVREVEPLLYPGWARPWLWWPSKEREVAERIYTDDERRAFERMGDLKGTPGLAVVIVPTYNRASRLDRTLQSVHAQTYPNWVCVVLDDGSTDNTADVMRVWQDRDPRFFYCRYLENRGGVAMNEIGMDLASEFGEYWVRLGSDDYWLPHKLELDMQAFAHGGKLVYGPYRDLHDPDGTGVGEWVQMHQNEIRNQPVDATGWCRSGGFAASWANIAAHVDVLRAVKQRHSAYCHPDLRNMEDKLFNARAAFMFEFTWRGIVGSELVIGARSLNGTELEQLKHDGVWRIGTDGASNKAAICNKDEVITNRLVQEESQRFEQAKRVEQQIVRIPWVK
jgi:glycosyltransferase involved in cell wall biosynthesis